MPEVQERDLGWWFDRYIILVVVYRIWSTITEALKMDDVTLFLCHMVLINGIIWLVVAYYFVREVARKLFEKPKPPKDRSAHRRRRRNQRLRLLEEQGYRSE